MAWARGTQIGSYEVVDVLGHGGMGEVYRVRHLITDRIEAMKILVSAAESVELRERFNREIRVLGTLNHPNIAGLHTAFYHEDHLIMVMEFVEGEDLGRRFSSGFTLQQSLDVTSQILAALEYAHSLGVVHRDIKPSNIMLTPGGRIKLLDFGLALCGPDTRLTSAGGVVGSMHYISPEQISGEPADARSDLYAVGITLYEMLTGKLPIEGSNYAQIIANHLQHHPAPPASINPQVPEAISAVVMKALAKDKTERWQSAAEFGLALRDAQTNAQINLQASSQTGIDAARAGDVSRLASQRANPNVPAANAPQGSGSRANPAVPNPAVQGGVHKPEVLNEIALQLASHVGPIANILVKRASSSAHNVRDLCELVAMEIESPEARKKFLSSVQGQLRASGHYESFS
jgi:serine/threonine-protein kinase